MAGPRLAAVRLNINSTPSMDASFIRGRSITAACGKLLEDELDSFTGQIQRLGTVVDFLKQQSARNRIIAIVIDWLGYAILVGPQWLFFPFARHAPSRVHRLG